MGFTYSPLRYPGGKSRLRKLIKRVFEVNGLEGGHYIEPFAGGAGIAWSLLIEGVANRVTINDIDPAIYAFWCSVFEDTEELCRLIDATPVTIDEWRKQKSIYEDGKSASIIELGFATFFLNRTNRSGIISGGVIGGKDQSAAAKLDARFNKADLKKRILRIAEHKGNVTVYGEDALGFISSFLPDAPDRSFFFIDPPYVGHGADLYANPYSMQDHISLADLVTRGVVQPWIVAYDNVPEVREMYRSHQMLTYDMSYSAQSRYIGSEVVIYSDGLEMPSGLLPVPNLKRPDKIQLAPRNSESDSATINKTG